MFEIVWVYFGKGTITHLWHKTPQSFIINTNQRGYDKFFNLIMVLWVESTLVYLLADSMWVHNRKNIFYFVRQMLCIFTYDDDYFSMRNIFFFLL
jgi:hypothetical protein